MAIHLPGSEHIGRLKSISKFFVISYEGFARPEGPRDEMMHADRCRTSLADLARRKRRVVPVTTQPVRARDRPGADDDGLRPGENTQVFTPLSRMRGSFQTRCVSTCCRPTPGVKHRHAEPARRAASRRKRRSLRRTRAVPDRPVTCRRPRRGSGLPRQTGTMARIRPIAHQ